ncbi:hypothetical protein MBLNU459_g0113t2 [Dothideomycetes sp. NU459]
MAVHKIVQLDGHQEIPPLDFPVEKIVHVSTKPSEVADRIEDATIVIATATKLTYETLMNHGPKLQLIASLGIGVDNIDPRAVVERGLTLVNVPAQNTDAVTEHAFALYGAVKRRILPLHNWAMGGEEWAKSGMSVLQYKTVPRTNREETLGVVGYGALGKSTEKMGKALGMRVLVAERKGTPAAATRPGRLPFADVLAQSTVLILTCPLDASTRNMVDEPELRTLPRDAILVNVGRGGIVNERALARALRDGTVAGAATDVFEHEPATTENCPLLDESIPNLVITPHIAWFSSATLIGTKKVTKANLEAFAAGKPQNVVIGPKSVNGTAATASK